MAGLNEEQMTEINDAIVVFDKVGDGKVAVEDIIKLLRALEMNPGSKEWDDVVNGYHKDGVERIDAKEFAVIYEEESKKSRASRIELVEGLKAIDPTMAKSGMVNAATLKRYMSLFGDNVSDSEADLIIAPNLDAKGSNVIIEDIVKLVMGNSQ